MFKVGILGQLNFLQKLKSLNSPPEKNRRSSEKSKLKNVSWSSRSLLKIDINKRKPVQSL